MNRQSQFTDQDPNNAVIDWSVLDTFLALCKPGRPDPRARLIRVFLDSTPDILNQIRNAITTADARSLAGTAHSMKSGSMNVGAAQLGALCAELEKIGRSGTTEGAKEPFTRAEAQYEAVATAFRTVLSEIDGLAVTSTTCPDRG